MLLLKKDGNSSDLDRLPKPFDVFVLHHSSAFYAINYNFPADKTIYMIDIDTMKQEILTTTQKSLSQQRASEIAFDIINL